uniref:RING-type E3 ubiquitin transferase n=1 Tax=Steinernema glaseri TaxID=37863 RepID=A0A1I8ALZ0_9BILA
MASDDRHLPWDISMCCSLCRRPFSIQNAPINLECGHSLCTKCLRRRRVCPVDKIGLNVSVDEAPVNFTFLRMLGLVVGRQGPLVSDRQKIDRLDGLLARIGRHFTKSEAQQSVSVTSTSLSRAVQRKALAVLRASVINPSGRFHCLRSIKSVADRIQNEVMLPLMTVTKSSQIWDVLRNRRCQFLGPAPHMAVLKEIHLLYKDGFALSRKTATKAITQKLLPDFPTVSKTAIGHLFQILYCARMFIVVPRNEGCVLLRLKPEFDNFEDFHFEHDTSLVRIVLESGLRVDQKLLSKLLYGTLDKQRHIQSIIDRLQNADLGTRKFTFPVALLVEKTLHGGPLSGNAAVAKMVSPLQNLEALDYNVAPEWDVLLDAAKNVADLIDAYGQVRPDERGQ